MSNEICPRCKGIGRIIKKEIAIPDWCHKIEKENHKRCCICDKSAYYQEGDGKYIHSLCQKHYVKIKHFCGGEDVWKPVCNECKEEVLKSLRRKKK